jgi:hypothetical protein
MELSTEICESRQVRSRILGQPQGGLTPSFRLHIGPMFHMSLDMLFAKIAALGVHGLRNARGSIAIGEVAGAGYECSPRTRAGLPVGRCHILSAFTLGATPSMVPVPDCCPTWFLVRSTSTHTRYTASYNHAWRRFEVRDGVGNWLIPSGLQPASVKAIAVG